MSNHETVLSTILEGPVLQEKQIVALQTKIEILQAEMAEIKK